MKDEYILKTIEAALLAGAEIMKVYEDPEADFQVERKADNSPLTIADRRANETIIRVLQQMPYPVLSEEGKLLPYADRAAWKELWVVDPLDGTKEFIKRNGEFTVNIAFVRDGVPVMGVIYVPVKRDLYFAAEGLGAFKLADITGLEQPSSLQALTERAVRLPVEEKRDTFVVVASRSHSTPETEAYIERMRREHGQVELRSSGSSLKICLIAEGKADVYPRFAPTMEWDTAAGHAIVRAAGGEIWQADKHEPLQYNKENLLNPWFIVMKN